MRKWEILGTLFFTGYFPVYPSIIGGLWGVLFSLLTGTKIYLEIGVILILFFIGVLSARERTYCTENPDPSEIIIDEAVGIMVTLLFIKKTLVFVIAGFFSFELFDFLKPFPIKRIENIKMGFGVILDDFVAGIYANVVLHLWIFLYSALSKGRFFS